MTQRIIEVFSQLPFLFVVMVLADFVPMQLRGMFLILSLLALFGWMHISYLVRTATMEGKNAGICGCRPCYGSRYAAYSFPSYFAQFGGYYHHDNTVQHSSGGAILGLVGLLGLRFAGHVRRLGTLAE